VSGAQGVSPAERATGKLWWVASHAWGLLVGAVLVVAPLAIGVMLTMLIGSSPGVSLLIGTVAAIVIGLPPWGGESWRDALLAIGGIVASWLGWQWLRDPDVSLVVLEICVMLGVAGWILRPMVVGAGRGPSTGE
jgi:hypothetical protein